MKVLGTTILAVLTTTALYAQVSDPASPLTMQRWLQASIKKLAPTIVTIETFAAARLESSTGTSSGLVISRDGWIVVSSFALNSDPIAILVTLADGRNLPARRAGQDRSRGIALLKIEATDLPIPEFLEPSQVRVGQWAFALGRTFGRDVPSVHMGIVSAKDRIYGRAIQVDANTSPANYGGPVIDLQGRVLGIAVPLSPAGRDVGADWYDSGIGFATTIADILPLIERMKAGETLHRGWLGIASNVKHLGPGAELDQVLKGSPARGVGLRHGDVILTVNQVRVRNSFHLQRLIGANMAGDAVHLSLRRGKAGVITMTVFLAELPQQQRNATSKEEEAFTQPWEKGR